MRGALSVVLLSAMVVLVGCAEDDAVPNRHGSKATGATNPDGTPVDPAKTAAVSAAVTACSAVAPPTALSDAKDASDVHLSGSAVFFQTGTTVVRVLKDSATVKKTVFTSPNLVHSFADAKGLLLVERTSADDPNGTLRAFPAKGAATADDPAPPTALFPDFDVKEGDDPGGTTANTGFNSASIHIFGSDDDHYYAQADDANGDSKLVMYNRGDLGATTLVTSQKVISTPQLASGAVWYVEDNQRVFKVALATDDTPQGTATEVFGITYSQCNLAVNESTAFCSVGTAIESRDLTGASPKTLIDNAASKTKAPFGATQYFDGRLLVRSGAPDTEIKNVLRSISTTGATDEKFIACGRNIVTGVAIDSTNVVWTESDTGVFMAAR